MFKNVKIVSKNLFGFAILFALLLGLSGFSYFSIVKSGESFNRYHHLARDSVLAGRLQANMLLVRFHTNRFLKTGSKEDVEKYEKRLKLMSQFIVEATINIKKPERAEKVSLIRGLVDDYIKAFDKIVAYKKERDEIIYRALDPSGLAMREAITDIIESAYNDDDLTTAYFAGRTQEYLLLGRLYATKFLDTNSMTAVKRLNEELATKIEPTINRLKIELQDPERIALFEIFLQKRKVYLNNFKNLVELIRDRNHIINNVLDRIGPVIAEAAENIKLSVKKDQDILGPTVKEKNEQSIKIIIFICIASLIVSIVLGILIIQAIKPIGMLAGIVDRYGKGELDLRMDIQSGDEIGELAVAFNKMTIDLREITSSRDELNREITDRIKAEDKLRNKMYDLSERHKELGGLYALSELINQTGVSLENILQRAVKLIPHSWQYPDITCGRITFEGMEFKTDNFKQTKWLQSADIIVDKNKVGALEVCYLQEKPECDEGPFLKEEVDLINAFVQQLGLFIENMQAVNNIKHLASFPQLNVNPILEIDYTGKVVFNNDAAVNTLNMLSVENDLALFIPGNFTKIVKSLKEGETVQYYTEVEIGDLLFAETIHLVDDFQVLRIYARDITAWHEVTEKLKLSEKMASLGQLTSGVFHELLNPVNIISSHIQLLLMDAERGSKTESDLKSIQEEISRIVKISDGLLRFARKGNSSREIVNINDLLEKTISIVEPDMKLDNVKFDRELDISLPRIAVDSDEMRQVFLNLITNARDAMPEGGTITVQTQTVQRGYECHLRIPNPEHKGYYIEISFEDTGCGIEKSKVEMVFDPFYTSKEVGKGTGLGLNTSYNIITQHGGMLSVKSEVGKGSIFIIDLPIVS